MKYKSIPTIYSGTQFRSRLEARWAAFFDLAEWKWEYEPIDLEGWIPDFWVQFYCGRDCTAHELHVEVKPYRCRPPSINKEPCNPWIGHPVMKHFDDWIVPAPAAFGISPDFTAFVISHGDGGGVFDVPFFANANCTELWRKAGNLVQWRSPNCSGTARKPSGAVSGISDSGDDAEGSE